MCTRRALLTIAFAVTLYAQAPRRTFGTVVEIDAAAHTMWLRTDAGEMTQVSLLPSIGARRVAPGESTLANAVPITIDDVVVGDRVMTRGDSSIVVMSQAEIAKRQAADRADWEQRGVAGLVTQVGRDAIVIRSRTLDGVRCVRIVPAAGAVFRRYEASNKAGSIRFADAKLSSLADIRRGDQVRARGRASEDGSRVVAEEIVSGSFRTFAGVIVSLNPESGEIRFRDLRTKYSLVLAVGKDSNLRRLEPRLAETIAGQIHPELAHTVAVPKPGRVSKNPDFHAVLEQSPRVTLAELRIGDALVVSASAGRSADYFQALHVMAGVEPILAKPAMRQVAFGAWSVDAVDEFGPQ